MPTSLPDNTTKRLQSAGVTRRAFLRLPCPTCAPAAHVLRSVARFTALPLDLAMWLRCGFSAPALHPG